jgi:hypothetical protein
MTPSGFRKKADDTVNKRSRYGNEPNGSPLHLQDVMGGKRLEGNISVRSGPCRSAASCFSAPSTFYIMSIHWPLSFLHF